MFDRTFIQPTRTETRYVTREVVEKRAPTDESVKLLREMEQAAEAKRIAGMQMPGNLFHGVVEVFVDHVSASLIASTIFDINGHRIKAHVRVDRDSDASAMLIKLRDETAKIIANEILSHMAQGLRLPS
jgi:hypothetical protein